MLTGMLCTTQQKSDKVILINVHWALDVYTCRVLAAFCPIFTPFHSEYGSNTGKETNEIERGKGENREEEENTKGD